MGEREDHFGATGAPCLRRIPACCGPANRGVAILDDLLFLGTFDAHLVALDLRTGTERWDVTVGDYKVSHTITVAPLALKDKVIVGIAGGDWGIRGFLDAYEAKTGKRAWRLWTVPGPGEPGNETWGGDSWKTGGATTWVTGSYDPELNLIYWGTGNPGPDYDGEVRPGDNLYSASLLGHRRRFRETSLAFSVHSTRRPRLGLQSGTGPRRTASSMDGLGNSCFMPIVMRSTMCSIAQPESSFPAAPM